MARTARTHLHYVHIVDDLFAVELRQGARRWTIGRVAGRSGYRASWVGFVITVMSAWEPARRVATRRAATEVLLAANGLMFAQATGGTVVPAVKAGDLVEYHGSYAWFRGDRFVVGEVDELGRYALLVPGTEHAELLQVRRASFTPVPTTAAA
jgi:hypothetical protein